MNEKGSDFSQLTNETCQVNMFSDASGEGYGGYIAIEASGEKTGEVYGAWDAQESCMSSTWRELEAVNRLLKSNKSNLSGQGVKVHTDSKNVETILKIGSKKTFLHDINMDIQDTCLENDIVLCPKWIPRDKNQEADALSRVGDCDDWGIQTWVFELLDKEWGPHYIDRFAAQYNRKCENFNSKFCCEGTNGIDAFKQNWSDVTNWWVPPPSLVTKTINKIVFDHARGTLVIPEWKSAPYWTLITDGSKFKSYVKSYKRFQGYMITHRGRGRNGVFGKSEQNFGFIALYIEP